MVAATSGRVWKHIVRDSYLLSGKLCPQLLNGGSIEEQLLRGQLLTAI
jgi:hypothetical protein